MRISNLARTLITALLLAHVTGLSTRAFLPPQQEVAAPSGKTTKHRAGREPTSSPAKQTGALIEYRNAQYGFCFSLSESWRGYSIVVDQWQGYTNGPHGIVTVQRGPIVSIRHPQWTAADPRQDIPIMVFTLAQWRSLQHAEFLVSAAGVGPSELGRNRRYVFALPPRYDYAFPNGYEEVEQIVRSHPLHGKCKTRGDHHG
jgi:hypothetical protein